MFDESEPYRGDSDSHRHRLADINDRQARAVGMPSRQHEFRARGGHCEGQSPGIGMKHGYHGQYAVTRGNCHPVHLQQAQRMQKIGVDVCTLPLWVRRWCPR